MLRPAQDDLGGIARLWALKVSIGIDPQQCPPTKPGRNGRKFPLGPGRLQDLQGVDAHALEDERKLVQERDVQIALVFSMTLAASPP